MGGGWVLAQSQGLLTVAQPPKRDSREALSAREQADKDEAQRKRRGGKVPGAFLRSRRSYTPSRRVRSVTAEKR